MPAPRVSAVTCIGPRQLRIVFTDGLIRELDFRDTLRGILATIDDDKAFAAVTVDEITGTISWPGGIDMDPDVLHGDFAPASGPSPELLSESLLHNVK